MPLSFLDMEAYWSESGWRGWKWYLAVSIGSLWIPLAAEFTVATVADIEVASLLFIPLSAEVCYGWGDYHDNPPELRPECGRHNRDLMAPRRGADPPTESGVEVR